MVWKNPSSILNTSAWLFENRLMLISDQKLTEVFIRSLKVFLKATFKLVVKRNVSQTEEQKYL